MVHDAYGMLLSETDPLNHTTTNACDANHNLISVTDPLSRTTSYTYDRNGNQTSVTYPRTATSVNTTRVTVYNQYGEPEGTRDELGNVRAFAYDSNFLPKWVIDNVDGSPTVMASFIFSANGTIQAKAVGYDLTVTPEKATRNTYDVYGNPASETDPLGRQTLYTYDSMGRRLAMTAPGPATTTYEYDALGRLKTTAEPMGKVTSYEYDANGNKTAEVDR